MRLPKEMVKKTTEEFIQQCLEKHGDYYDYSFVEYVGSHEKVIIGCPTHKTFNKVIAKDHLHQGNAGCKQCRSNRISRGMKLTTADYVGKFKNVFKNDEYDYSEFVYRGDSVESKIYCNKHELWFYTRPTYHVRGLGCVNCQKEFKENNKIVSVKSRIYEMEILSNKKLLLCGYEISDVYKNRRFEKILKCNCGDCGFEYDISLNSFIRSYNACPICTVEKKLSNNGYLYNKDYVEALDDSIKSSIYYVRFTKTDGTTFDKIGVTKNIIKKRFVGSDKYGFKIQEVWVLKAGLKTCVLAEIKLKEELQRMGLMFKCYELKGTPMRGWTECFYNHLDKPLFSKAQATEVLEQAEQDGKL